MPKLSFLSLRGALDAHDASLSYKRAIPAGALLGLAWGILSRLWVRLVSDAPEFTVSGAAITLGASTAVTFMMLHFWPPLNTAAYLALYLLLLYPLVVAMRTGLGTTAWREQTETTKEETNAAAESLPLAA